MTKWAPALLATLVLSASTTTTRAQLDALVETKRFNAPGIGDRVDVNISVIGNTAFWVMDERGFQQAQVEALTVVEQDGRIVDFRKTLVRSPERSDTLQGDFIHQERFVLRPGSYSLSVELHDRNLADTARTSVRMPLVVPARTDDVSISDILFIIQGKEGAAPFPGTYYPGAADKLGFYAEVYGTLHKFGKDGPFLGLAQIEGYESGQVAGNFRSVQRLKADTIVPLSMEFGIGRLPTGNYLLAVEVRDRNDSLVGRKTQFFQRYNPIAYDPAALMEGELGSNFTDAYTDADTLAEFLGSMRPVADELERKMIDDRWKDKKPELMRQLMFTFWYNRAPNDPKAAWERYLQAVEYVNKRFGCRNQPGYQSDQGYIYLRYGAPNTVVDRANSTSALPYMIWHYYRAGRYTNRRFVFYQPERSTTCWTLLTSDMPGEINNNNWLDVLIPGNADGGVERGIVLDNFNNPR